ncbi:MAG TPA: glycosyltransferase family A protein, partial [Ktedonobacterales bacterium]|nr:glycosyltransferase family A protein [Ktedonobacterales bacterium]
MIIYLDITVMLLGVLLLNLVGSLAALRRVESFTPAPRAAGAWPRISVLIPARDEAANIESCLESLLAQEHPDIEILVLDDESTDETATIVQRVAAGDDRGRVTLIRGKPLPEGWLGKCHACAQLAEHATGDYLIFTDADTRHGTASLSGALAATEQRHLGLVSVLPRQRALTPPEQLLMPLLSLNILALLPVGLVRQRPEPSLSAGVGQFLCFRRAAYESAGGHAAVRDRVLDDVMLARRVKRAGYCIDLLDGGAAVQCRMYDSFGAIWRGFSKNLYAFYGQSPVATLIAVGVRLALFVAPSLLAIAGVLARWPAPHIILALAAYLLAVAMRLLLAARVGTIGTDPRDISIWWSALLHPVAEAMHCAITLNSMRWGLRRHLTWKGRTYQDAHRSRQKH